MKFSKLSPQWNILVLCALVSCVYFLRTSPHASTNRSLQTAPAQSSMCDGVDLSESFTQSQIDRADDVDTYLNKVRGGNQLLSDIDTADTADDFLREYGKSLLPFIIIGLVLAFLSLVCCCCHCCNYGYLRCCTVPTKMNKIIWMGFSVLFSMAMVALAAVGLYFTRGLDTGYLKGTCSVSSFIVEFSAGNMTAQWIGLAPAVDSIQDVADSIVTTIDGLPDADETHANMTANYNSLLAAIQAYDTNNEGMTVSNPNTSLAAIIPDFITALGPYTNNNSLSGALMVEAENKYTAVDGLLQLLGPLIDSLKGETSSISSTLQSGVDLADSLNDQVNTILNDYENYSDTGKKINSGVSLAIMIFFIVSIVLSAIILLGVINSFTWKKSWICKFMVFIRYVLNIILILSSLVLAIAWPASVATMEACNATNQLITNETLFNQYFPNDSVIGLVSTCFYGNGSVLNAFGIDDIFSDLNSIFQNNETLVEYLNIPDSVVIPAQNQSILLYQNGTFAVNASVTTELTTLNTYTYSPGTCSLDTWVLNSVNCTPSMGTLFNANTPQGAQFNLGNPTCIGFDIFSSFSNGNERYTSSSCPNINSNAVPLVNGFKAHLSSVNTVFSTLESDLNAISAINVQFMSNVTGVITPFAGVGDAISNIIQIVGNQTGLFSNMNCAFIGTNTQSVHDNVCIGYLPILFETCVFLFFFSLVTLLGLTPVFFAGKIQMHSLEAQEGNNLDDSFSKRYLIENSNDKTVELASMGNMAL